MTWIYCYVLLPMVAVLLRLKDDAELVERLCRRDPDAMADLYDRYGRLTYSLILRVVRNQATAEDLVQETFLRVWNRVQYFDAQKGALGAWILTVARNRAIDFLRSAEQRMMESSADLDRLDHPSMFSNIDSDLLNIDRVRMLKNAFEKLPANQRTVLELAYYEGLSQTEMAERLNQPLGTVKTWVRTALRILREELSEAVVA